MIPKSLIIQLLIQVANRKTILLLMRSPHTGIPQTTRNFHRQSRHRKNLLNRILAIFRSQKITRGEELSL